MVLEKNVFSELLLLTTLNRNRIIEILPLMAKKYELIHKFRKAFAYLVTQHSKKWIEKGVQWITENYSFNFRAKCAIFHASYSPFEECGNKKEENLKQFPCPKCLRKYENNTHLDLINKLLPPDYSKKCDEWIQNIFKNIIDCKSNYSAKENDEILQQYFSDLLAWTISTGFDVWSKWDGLTRNEAKIIIYIQLFRFIEFVHYKYLERMNWIFEGGIVIAPLLRNPSIGNQIAKNIVSIGFAKWMARTCWHLNINNLQCKSILKIKVQNGYFGGVRYLHDSIWNLIQLFLNESKYLPLLIDKKYKLLLKWIDINTITISSTIPIENINKPMKEMKGQQTITEENINRTHWNRINLTNSLFHHPIYYYLATKKKNKKLKLPLLQRKNKYCQAFELPTKDEWKNVCKLYNLKEKKYKNLWRDPNYALEQEHDAMSRRHNNMTNIRIQKILQMNLNELKLFVRRNKYIFKILQTAKRIKWQYLTSKIILKYINDNKIQIDSNILQKATKQDLIKEVIINDIQNGRQVQFE